MNGQTNWLADNWATIVAATISGLAALASIAAARKSIAAQNRLLKIEEQREQDRVSEIRKARLVARIVRKPPPPARMSNTPDFFLEIKNLGQNSARDIDVVLDDVPVLKHPTMLNKSEEVRKVGPLSSYRHMLAPHSAARLPHSIKIAWQDDSAESGHYETTLTQGTSDTSAP